MLINDGDERHGFSNSMPALSGLSPNILLQSASMTWTPWRLLLVAIAGWMNRLHTDDQHPQEPVAFGAALRVVEPV